MHCISLDDCIDCVKEVMSDKNPIYKLNFLKWLGNYLDAQFAIAKDNELQQIVKQLSNSLK